MTEMLELYSYFGYIKGRKLMKKRCGILVGIFLIICTGCGVTTTVTPQKDVELETETLKQSTEDEKETENLLEDAVLFYTNKALELGDGAIVTIIVDDFDKNGTFEAFAITTDEKTLEWINSDEFDGGCSNTVSWFLSEEDEVILDNEGDTPYTLEKITEPNGDILVYDKKWENFYNTQSDFYAVRDGECVKVQGFSGNITTDDGTLNVNYSDFFYDEYKVKKSYYEYDGTEYTLVEETEYTE